MAMISITKYLDGNLKEKNVELQIQKYPITKNILSHKYFITKNILSQKISCHTKSFITKNILSQKKFHKNILLQKTFYNKNIL